MNQQGAARGHEDDWWRQLYGDGDGSGGAGEGAPGRGAVCDAGPSYAGPSYAGPSYAGPSYAGPSDVGPSGAPDTLDDRVESALRALRGPRRAAPAPRAPRDTSRPTDRRAAPSPRAPRDTSPPADRRAAPSPRGPRDTPPPATAGLAGDRPPSPGAVPGELPAADPAALDDLVPDTTLDGARYGALTLRAASQRGDAARRRGDIRRDALLTARFGAGRHALILVAVATGRPSADGAHRAARDACTWIGGAVGRSYTRLAEDIRTDRRGALKSGLQRLTDRSYGTLRGRAPEQGAAPERHPAALRCLLLPADPDCRTRVFFGVGAGGLFLLRDGAWQDLEPTGTDHLSGKAAATGPLPRPAPGPAHDPYPDGSPVRPEPFLFRTAFARPGDTLLLCSAGLAEPLREEPAFAARLADRWSADGPPGLVDFLTAAQLRAEGHPKDRTAVGVWES
ncbi:protein phosphatase 2C domain-containing protein [Streptomyces sp. NPDC015125]|uniref:protein phosphatase 2C domain-containing protein n=1 Tax=Streptomyces sp. NPDC015125 TaxID=3364938 RepID=UPI0036FCA24E